jgi:hypothetical protein
LTDPLEAVTEPSRRSQLEALRELDGVVRTSAELRGSLPGFKGQKGIYKPRGSPYALWVRQTLRGAYPDREPVVEPDGSWKYDYAPEGRAGHPDMTLDTNRALLRCMEEKVPIGVIRQIRSPRGERLYEVRGLGYVTSFDGSHFTLRGEPIDVTARPVEAPSPLSFVPFDKTLHSMAPTLRTIREARFKLAVRRIYHERCSLCNIGYHVGRTPLAIEAAHIIPVQNDGTSRDVRNGILLCSNHHALFDSYAWTFDEDLRVLVTSDTEFRRSASANHVIVAEGRKLSNLPDDLIDYPDGAAIRFRINLFEKNQ